MHTEPITTKRENYVKKQQQKTEFLKPRTECIVMI